jgi:putative transposase
VTDQDSNFDLGFDLDSDRKYDHVRIKGRLPSLTPEQSNFLAQCAGNRRFVWNHFRNLQKHRLDKGLPLLSYCEMSAQLTALKALEGYEFLKLSPATSLQQALRDLSNTLEQFKARKRGFPRTHRKFVRESFRVMQQQDSVTTKRGRMIVYKDADSSSVHVPLIGRLPLHLNNKLKGTVTNVTFIRQPSGWKVSVSCRTGEGEGLLAPPSTANGNLIGVDLGVKKTIVASNGFVMKPLNLDRDIRNLRRLAKIVSRRNMIRTEEDKKLAREGKLRQSKGFREAVLALKRQYEKIRNKKDDYENKAILSLITGCDGLACEDLNFADMSRQIEPTEDGSPREGVAAKRFLNKSLRDSRLGTVRRKMEWKCKQQGKPSVRVSAVNTSRTCSSCSHVSEKNRRTQAGFRCTECGSTMNADYNASVNILERGKEPLLARQAKMLDDWCKNLGTERS